MSVKSSVRNLIDNEVNSAIDNAINNNFAMLEDFLNQEIHEIEKMSPYRLKLNKNDLDELEKLIDSFISPQNTQIKNYQQATNFLKIYS